MNLTSIGDLAQNMMLRTRSTQLKQSIERLTQELSTGQTTDVVSRVGGDLAYLADIERNLGRLDSFSLAATEASVFTSHAQSNLERLHDASSSLSSSLLATAPSNLPSVRSNLAHQARSDLEVIMGSLNASVAGRSIFGGIATDRAPLGTSDDLLNALSAELSGLTSATDIEQAASDWFDDPAGFSASLYSGSSQNLAGIQVGSGQVVSVTIKANDSAFRDLIKSVSLAALATDPALGLDSETQNEILQSSGQALLGSQNDITSLRADLGFTEARIEEAMARNEAARTSLEFAKSSLLDVDPFETATRLENVQFQLESLYSVTVRTSRLSLLSFLR
ncbi:MAG: flagellin [Sedimentitalea sp.]